MENPIKMDDFGGTPILGNTHIPVTLRCKETLSEHLMTRSDKVEWIQQSCSVRLRFFF